MKSSIPELETEGIQVEEGDELITKLALKLCHSMANYDDRFGSLAKDEQAHSQKKFKSVLGAIQNSDLLFKFKTPADDELHQCQGTNGSQKNETNAVINKDDRTDHG